MKTKILLTILFSIIINFGFAQCKQQFVYSCDSGGISIFLKSFNTVLLKDKNTLDSLTKFKFELRKGCHYSLNLGSPDYKSNKIFLNLYDSRDSLLVFDYYENNEYIESYDFVCQKTDNYYITINSDFKARDKIDVAIVLLFVGRSK